jgi:hypothetical protein
MFDIATMTPMGTLELPAAIASRFHLHDRFIVWMQGDTLHLKRIETASPLQAVADAPDEEPMSLDESDAIIHAVRQRGHPDREEIVQWIG